MARQGMLYVHIYTLFNPATVMGCEGTISLRARRQKRGCRHWFSSGVGWGSGWATAHIHWKRIGSDKFLWIHPTIPHWARSNSSQSFHRRFTLTAAAQMTGAQGTDSPQAPRKTTKGALVYQTFGGSQRRASRREAADISLSATLPLAISLMHYRGTMSKKKKTNKNSSSTHRN